MENKITKINTERKNIIAEYSSKKTKDTHIDTLAQEIKDLQYVIIKDIVEETPDAKSFILTPDSTKGTYELAPFTAGQYISIKMFVDDIYVTRAYSLSSSPTKTSKMYRITIKRVEGGLVSNIMLDEMKIGDTLTISRPIGDFGYNRIRDEKNIIAIAGGSGITPFMSMAYAILNKVYDANLTVFYSVRKEEDIIFKDEIKAINKKSKKVKFVITLTREEKEGYFSGHINKEMLEPYLKEFNTIFMCGPKTLYKTMNEILSEFNIPKKSVHYENFFVDYTPSEIQEYELKVILKNDFVLAKCKSNETLLVSMEKAGIKAPSMCRVGVCGYCKSILLEGKIKMIGSYLKEAEAENDYIHPCITYPESDIVLRLDI